jgi:hypothetical protein
MDLIVGLPLSAVSGPDAEETKTAVKAALSGTHHWLADGVSHEAYFDNVLVASQPVGALYDWMLDSNGKVPADRKALREKELGVLGLGMNTVDLLAVERLVPTERFTGGYQVGVRRLLELSNTHGLYTIAEMDERLRAGKLDTSASLQVWKNDVYSVIDRQWSDNSWRRFAAIVIVGGGSILLRDALSKKFGLLAQFPADAVISTARGLYKFAVMKKLHDAMAFDAGFGGVKLFNTSGSVVLPAAVSSNGYHSLGDLAGLKSAHRPLHIESAGGSFYVGQGAHKFGRPVQSLDLDRLTGPEMLALLYGALSARQALDGAA